MLQYALLFANNSVYMFNYKGRLPMGTIHSLKRSLSREQWQTAWRIARERAAACPSDKYLHTFGIPGIAWAVWKTREQMRYQELQRATPAWLRVAYRRAAKQIDQRFV